MLFAEANWVEVRGVVPMMRWRKLKVIFTACRILVGKDGFFLPES